MKRIWLSLSMAFALALASTLLASSPKDSTADLPKIATAPNNPIHADPNCPALVPVDGGTGHGTEGGSTGGDLGQAFYPKAK